MTKQTQTVLALSVIAIALSGCGASGSKGAAAIKPAEKITPAVITEGQEKDLFPCKVGNTWTYDGTTTASTPGGNRSSNMEITFKVVDVVDGPEGTEIMMHVLSDGIVTDHLGWRVGPKGIYETSGSIRDPKTSTIKEIKFEPPLAVVPFPPKAGFTANSQNTGVRPGATPGAFTSDISVDGIQEVDTAAGRLSALSTTQESNYTEGVIKVRSTSTAYWAPKIGIIRYHQDVAAVNDKGQSLQTTTVLRLKSHNP